MNTLPKLLFFDTEVSPHFGSAYDKYETTLMVDRLQFLMSVSWKWLGKEKIETYCLPDFRSWKKDKFDDSELVEKMWEVVNKAEIVVAHNAKKFDIRKINTRFVMNDLKPPRPYKVIDTLQVARKYFSFPGNSLNDLAKFFGVGEKLEKTHSDLWKSCINGDKKAWKWMRAYNRQDVVLLEGVYQKMQSFIDPFPIVRNDNERCRHCDFYPLLKEGFSYAKFSKKQQFSCPRCGSWSSGKSEPLD